MPARQAGGVARATRSRPTCASAGVVAHVSLSDEKDSALAFVILEARA